MIYLNISVTINIGMAIAMLCLLKNVISLICFTILAVVFKHWWIVFFSLLFYSYTEKEK